MVIIMMFVYTQTYVSWRVVWLFAAYGIPRYGDKIKS